MQSLVLLVERPQRASIKDSQTTFFNPREHLFITQSISPGTNAHTAGMCVLSLGDAVQMTGSVSSPHNTSLCPTLPVAKLTCGNDEAERSQEA